MFTPKTTIGQVIQTPEFQGFGHLLFPVHLHLKEQTALAEVVSAFPWYSCTHSSRTVSILNELAERVRSGETVFYSIYSQEEIAADPEKAETGLFFFRGSSCGKTAIVNAGGGFQYVAALHDSLPHCQKLAHRGYNAFALIYRPGSQTGCRDLARAIAWLHESADKLAIDMSGYSLWGGSAGARLAAWLGERGTAAYGERSYPKASTVITQYTGLSTVTGKEPATFALVGTRDWIADYRTVRRRIEELKRCGVPAEYRIYQGLSHGFGLGEGTKAEHWLDEATAFWEKQLTN